MKITPVSLTVIDTTAFVEAAVEAGLQNPALPAVESRARLKRPATDLALIAGLKLSEYPPAVFRLLSGSLDHYHIGVLVEAEPEVLQEIRDWSRLPVRGQVGIALVTGSLRDWREAILSRCSPEATPNVRQFYDFMVMLLDHMGLGEVLGEHTRRPVANGTFTVEG